MVRGIVTDVLRLGQRAAPAGREDLCVVQDLLDTLRANSGRCVGLAANMIGVNKRIIVVDTGALLLPMLNPVVVGRSQETYEVEEGCLSHQGAKRAVRHQSVEVEFYDVGFHKRRRTFSGFPAQIVQHELDHCEGILI